jgi:hypothetical protein
MLNEELIKSLCQISGLVYKPVSFFNNLYYTRPYTKNIVSFYNLNKKPMLIESNEGCQCYISIFNKNSILCAFRGTENNTADWLSDINIIRRPMDLINLNKNDRPLVHWGILRQFRSVEKTITEYIDQEIKNKNIKNIIYTGHSLGGALATIATQNYGHKYPKLNHICVTFGSPRCGDENFKKRFNNICSFSRRYVNKYDPVPSLPFSFLYTHVGPSKQINDNNIVDIDNTIYRSFYILWFKFINILGNTYNPVNDHSIYNYYDKLCEIYNDKN